MSGAEGDGERGKTEDHDVISYPELATGTFVVPRIHFYVACAALHIGRPHARVIFDTCDTGGSGGLSYSLLATRLTTLLHGPHTGFDAMGRPCARAIDPRVELPSAPQNLLVKIPSPLRAARAAARAYSSGRSKAEKEVSERECLAAELGAAV